MTSPIHYGNTSMNLSQVSGTALGPVATTVQIGNSDDRLPQREWCEFINAVHRIMREHKLWFSGPSEARAPWQCFSWTLEGELTPVDVQDLRAIAARYRQRQIAVTVGRTTMIEPGVGK